MRLWRATLGSALTLVSVVNVWADEAAQDRCRDVLVYAARNKFQERNQSVLNTKARDQFCNNVDSASGNATNGNGGGGVPLMWSANVSVDHNGYQKSVTSICGDKTSALDNVHNDFVLRNEVDDYALSVWDDCMKANGIGPLGLVDQNGPDIVLTVKFLAGAGTDQTKVSNAPSLSNLTCEGTWPTGTTIGSGGKSILCKRKIGDAEATALVQTANGPVTMKVPAAWNINELVGNGTFRPAGRKCQPNDTMLGPLGPCVPPHAN